VHLKGGKVAVDAGAGRIELETKYPVLEGAAGNH